MQRLIDRLQELRRSKRKALIPYLTAGYPTPTDFPGVCAALERAGADAIEIGLPFSDPMADGPVIQRSSHVALDHGVRGPVFWEQVKAAREAVSLPLVIMSYLNPLLSTTYDDLAMKLYQYGVSALIVPDLPVEESDGMRDILQKYHKALIFLGAPTTKEERLQELAALSEGYFYLVSLTGTTGASESRHADLGPLIRSIRKVTPIPICIGFGISSPASAKALGSQGDGVIVGSALISRLARASESGQSTEQAAFDFLTSLREALDAA